MNPATLKKLVVGYIAAVPILIVITIVQFMSVEGVLDSHGRLGSAHEIIRQADALGSALTEAASAVHSFLATGNADSLKGYQALPSKTRESLQLVVKLTAGDADQQRRARKLETQVHQQLEWLEQALELPTKPGRKPEQPREAELRSEKQMGKVANTLAEIKKHEVDRLAALTAAAQESVARTNRLAPVAGVLAIWMVLLAALLLYRDATQRAWRGIERRIHTRLVETLPFGICLVDEHGLIIYTNSAQDTLFGYEPGGLIGRHITAVHNTPRGEGDALFDQAMETLGRQSEWRAEFPAQRKNTTTFMCVCQAVTMDMAGKMYRVFLLASAGTQPAT